MFKEKVTALLNEKNITLPIEVPPDPTLGDFALPCFTLAKERKKAPAAIAEEIANELDADFIERVETKGPYINIFIKPDVRARDTLAAVNDSFGRGEEQSERIMVEYSQPNTHKAFHVGHLRGTSIGESLSRILKYRGFDVIQANYSGDTGTHIAKWLWHYQKNPSDPPEDLHELEKWIANIYVSAVQSLENNEQGEREVTQLLEQLENDPDPKLKQIYEKTRAQSIAAFNQIYEDLNAHFDVWWFESEVEERGKEIANELVEEGIAIVDDGAVIMNLEDVDLGVWVLLRQGGTALYSAKDLALAEKKFTDYKIDRSIYAIGAAQSMHMQQLFETLKRMQFTQADKCHHLSFTEVRLPEGKMSSRTGQNLLYSDIKKQVSEYAREEVQSRHEDWSEEQIKAVVTPVTIAALKWDMLAINPNKTIVFDPKKATQFEGETGPYVQYTYARACSILSRAEKHMGEGNTLTHEKEQALLTQIGAFEDVLERSVAEYSPGPLANYTMQLAKAFNSFYHDCPVLQAEGEQKSDRLALVHATTLLLNTCLDLLAIDATEKM